MPPYITQTPKRTRQHTAFAKQAALQRSKMQARQRLKKELNLRKKFQPKPIPSNRLRDMPPSSQTNQTFSGLGPRRDNQPKDWTGKDFYEDIARRKNPVGERMMKNWIESDRAVARQRKQEIAQQNVDLITGRRIIKIAEGRGAPLIKPYMPNTAYGSGPKYPHIKPSYLRQRKKNTQFIQKKKLKHI